MAAVLLLVRGELGTVDTVTMDEAEQILAALPENPEAAALSEEEKAAILAGLRKEN